MSQNLLPCIKCDIALPSVIDFHTKTMKTLFSAQWILLLLSLLGTANFAYIAYLEDYISCLRMHRQYFGQLQFFTEWNVLIQLVFHAIKVSLVLSNGFFGRKMLGLRHLWSLFFEALAFPFGVNVFIVYWTVYWVNPEDIDIPHSNLVNHMKHSVMVLLLLPFCVFEDFSPVDPRVSVKITLVVISTYISWMTYLGKTYGHWTYRTFAPMNNWEQAISVVLLHLLAAALNLLGRALKRLWNKNGTVLKRHIQKMI